MKFFNIAGPVKAEKHYALPPLSRIDLAEVMMLIEQEKYFVLHAPRQSGKTSCLLALMHHLNQQGNYHCLYMNAEIVQANPEDMQRNIRTLLSEIAANARDYLRDPYPESIWMDVLHHVGEERALGELLSRWAAHSPQPLILLIDEIDALMSNTLISVLRQLRTGHAKRPHQFPQSVILCGVRDVRHYRLYSQEDQTFVTGGSVFNFKSEALRLGDFSAEQTRALYEQHTQATGQTFTPEALDRLWHLTQGQPWLVNALGYELCFASKTARDWQHPITRERVDAARKILLQGPRKPHFDHLVDKLWTDEARRVLEPLLVGHDLALGFRSDDIAGVRDLGLIRQHLDGSIEIANPLYRELIPRWLTWPLQSGMSHQTGTYQEADGTLNVAMLLADFQIFFLSHFENWQASIRYQEAAPLIMLQAFVQRVLDAHGRIEREYGLGRLQMDLLLVWPQTDGLQQRVAISARLLRQNREQTLSSGLRKTRDFMQRRQAKEGHLVIFDRTPGRPCEQRLFFLNETVSGQSIDVWGL